MLFQLNSRFLPHYHETVSFSWKINQLNQSPWYRVPTGHIPLEIILHGVRDLSSFFSVIHVIRYNDKFCVNQHLCLGHSPKNDIQSLLLQILMHLFLYQYTCHESGQKAKFQEQQMLLPQPRHRTCVLHLPLHLQHLLAADLGCSSEKADILLSRRHSASQHPCEKLGCAFSYLTTAPAAPETGTWNLGKEARGVKPVSTARAQWSRRWSSFLPCSFAPQLYRISPAFHDLHRWSERFFPVVLWSIRYWHQLEKEPQCPSWGKSPLGPNDWITGSLLHAKVTPAKAKTSKEINVAICLL